MSKLISSILGIFVALRHSWTHLETVLFFLLSLEPPLYLSIPDVRLLLRSRVGRAKLALPKLRYLGIRVVSVFETASKTTQITQPRRSEEMRVKDKALYAPFMEEP